MQGIVSGRPGLGHRVCRSHHTIGVSDFFAKKSVDCVSNFGDGARVMTHVSDDNDSLTTAVRYTGMHVRD